MIVIVNYSAAEAEGRVVFDLHGIDGRAVTLHDRMTGTDYPRDGAELVGAGLYVRLGPWTCHVMGTVST